MTVDDLKATLFQRALHVADRLERQAKQIRDACQRGDVHALENIQDFDLHNTSTIAAQAEMIGRMR